MDNKEAERIMLGKAVRYAFDKGQMVTPCLDRTEALIIRSKFYVYFNWLERQARYKRDIERVREAKELLEMRRHLTLGAYKNGELIIKKGGMAKTMELVAGALSKPDQPSRREVLAELDGVKEKVMYEEAQAQKAERDRFNPYDRKGEVI